jgi:hypothetical protein
MSQITEQVILYIHFHNAICLIVYHSSIEPAVEDEACLSAGVPETAKMAQGGGSD